MRQPILDNAYTYSTAALLITLFCLLTSDLHAQCLDAIGKEKPLKVSGLGVDLAPAGRFKFNAMYGQLQHAVVPDTTRAEVTSAYRRMGYGFKASYGTEKDTAAHVSFPALGS